MNSRFYKTRSIWVAIFLILVLISSCTPKDQVQNKKKNLTSRVSILYFNDFHGHLLPFKRFYGDKQPSGGFARLARMVNHIREENQKKGADTLVLSAGDNLQGSAMSTAFKGKVEFEVFNKLKLDAATIGNHDFDYSGENLFQLKELAKFPLISANILAIDSPKNLFDPYVRIKTKNKLMVGIVGLTTDETPITTHPLNVSNFHFARPELAMKRYIGDLDKSTDLLIVLSHLGIKKEREIAQAFPELDVIIGGHSHTLLPEPLYVGEVMLCQSGDRGLYLGRLDIEVKNDRAKMISARIIPIRDYLDEDKEIKAIIDEYNDKLSAETGRVIGKTDVFLNGERSDIRTSETNLGNLVADLIRMQADTDIAFVNGGAIRSSIQPGNITLGDIIRTLPMNNDIVTFDVSGDTVYLALERSIKGLLDSGPDELFGGFLQVSGIRFRVKDGKPIDIVVNGREIKLHKMYKVATVDFLSSGGDGYKMFKNSNNIYKTGITLRDLFTNYLKKNKTVKAKKDGRIIRL